MSGVSPSRSSRVGNWRMKQKPNPRLKKELQILMNDPGPGVSAWAENADDMYNIAAQIQGPDDSPYAGGIFSLSIQVPERFVKFLDVEVFPI